MTANNSKSYLVYLNKLVDQYNNTNDCSIGTKPIMLIILLWLKKLQHILKLLSLKLVIESELWSVRIFLVKATLKIGQEKNFINSVLKTNTWTYKIKDLNRLKIIGRKMQKNCSWVNFKWAIIQNRTIISEIK